MEERRKTVAHHWHAQRHYGPRYHAPRASGKEERYRNVVEDQTEIISRIKPDGAFLFTNETFCRFFDVQEEDLLEKSWQPVVVEEDIPIVKEKLGKISPANPVQIVENRVFRGDGEIRWMQFVNRGFFDEDGKLTEIQSLGRDITERKEIEAEKERLISELQKALSQIKTLSGLLPICSSCKRIRNDQGYWDRIESYIGKHSNAE